MSRLIDADALLDDIRSHSASYFADDFAREWVDKQPTVDAVPVIRCKHCKFYQLENGIDEYECTNSEGIMWTVTGEDYCSRGEQE